MLERLRTSKKAHLIIICAMFAVMLCFNMMTGLLADDFQYSFSFATEEKIDSFETSMESIISHGKYVNGRYFAHYLAQIFLLLPPILFDLINSAVFVFTVYAVYRICNEKNEINNLFLLAIFGSVWLFEHDFGQVNLWLDGSCNYLFAIFFGLLYIIPFINSVLRKKHLHPILILPHILLSVWFGGYLEPTSVGLIGAACLFVLIDVVRYKNFRALTFIPSILASFVGLATIVFAPAQVKNKMSEFSFSNFFSTFGVALLMVASIFPIIIVYVKLLKRAKKENVDERIIITSLVIALGAAASNFVLVIAKYYPFRCSMPFVFLSIFATALLYGNLERREFSERGKRFCKLLAVAFALALVIGFADNVTTFVMIKNNERIIEAAVENGSEEVELYRPLAFTKYNGVWGLRYLDIHDENGWPNKYIAKYYDLETVRGKSYFGDLFAWW